MREETDRKEIISLLRDRRVREEIDRGEIIAHLRGLRNDMAQVIALLENMAPKQGAAAATEVDQKAKEQLKITEKLVDEWKNGGEGDRWENL